MAEQDTTTTATSERKHAVPAEIPVLALRDTVLFPNSFMPLAVARDSSVALIDSAISGDKQVGVFTQRTASDEEPGQDGLPHRDFGAHPSDVQAPRRQPAPDRPGTDARGAGPRHADFAVPACRSA